MSEILREPKLKVTTSSAAGSAGLSPVDAVRIVVNTAVVMSEHEPGIDLRSVTESKRGPGILIWIPGYVHNGETIVIVTPPVVEEAQP